VQFLLPRKRKRKEIGEKRFLSKFFFFVAVVCLAASSSVVRRRQPLRHRFCRAMIFSPEELGTFQSRSICACQFSAFAAFFSASFELIGDQNTHCLLCEED